MKIWQTTYGRKFLKKACLIIFMVLSISVNAQKVPFEVRNFLLDFEKVIDLSEFDTAVLSNRFSTIAAEKFTNFFINRDILIYNDVAQDDGIPVYITPGEYVKKVQALYPIGLIVYISNTEIVDVKEFASLSLFVVEVEKTIMIDNMIDNPPTPKFISPVRLHFYITRNHSTNEIKIIGIESSGSAINNKTTYGKFYPDRLEFNAGIHDFNVNFKDVPEQYSGIETKGNHNRFGVLVGWDLSGKKNFRYGLSAGIFYDKTVFSTDLPAYEDLPIPSVDKDNLSYLKMVNGENIKQKNERSQVSIPVYLNLNWELPSRWGTKYARRSFTKDLSYRRGINFNFRIGPYFNYNLSGSNEPYSGAFSYGGQYTFYNPVIQDSSTILIEDLPEYGFASDTAFTTTNSNLSYNKFNMGLASSLNISFPIYKYIEIYVGPSLFYNFSSLAQKDDAYILSSEIGENNSLVNSSKTQSVSFGINAGIILNLHAPRAPYSTVELPAIAKSQFKPKTSYTVEKSSFSKMLLYVNLINDSEIPVSGKAKIPYQISSDWLKKPETGKFSGYKTHKLNYRYPFAVGKLNLQGRLVVRKPFGYDVRCEDTLAFNSVNQHTLEIPLDNLNKLTENHQTLDLKVDKLPNFTFIYISLYNVNETMEQRKSVVNLVRQIGNEAIYNQEELMVYLSSEKSRPITYTNFLSGELPDNIVTDWDQFLDNLEEKYNSQDLLYEADIISIDQILGPLVNLDERANAERRHVNYHYVVNESMKYYGYDPEIVSDIRSLIYFMSNKFCANIPFKSDQYTFNVYLTEKYKGERKSPSDININIEHLIK